MKRIRLLLPAALLVTALCSVPAHAFDYHFEGPASDDYYKPTPYEEVYGAYNYGGQNAVDFANAPELPGYHSSVQVQQPMVTTGSVTPIYDGTAVPGVSVPTAPGAWVNWSEWQPPQTAFTPASSVTRSDGSIGTLKIPSLGINIKAFEGETAASMKKGVGHFSGTSAWNGNVCLCGHNRGAAYTIGSIKDLRLGDTMTYATSLGTRTYRVTYVGKISATDWSRLGATADNRITLFTCVKDQPALRWCVQATEVS